MSSPTFDHSSRQGHQGANDLGLGRPGDPDGRSAEAGARREVPCNLDRPGQVQPSINGLGEDRGATTKLHFQNECVVAFRDAGPAGMTPDILTVVDSAAGERLQTGVIDFGQRVRVISLTPWRRSGSN